MDFLENVKGIVESGARTVVKKSSELIDASKTQYAIFELNNDVKKLYSEIGKLAYKSVADGADHNEEIKMKCDIVTAKLVKIYNLKNNNDSLSVKCPVCNRPVDNENSYCPSCGVNLADDND